LSRSFPIAVKQLESVLCFKFGNLPTEGGLRNSQPMRRAREIQLFGQNYYRIQMSNIDLGEHRLKALGARNTWIPELPHVYIRNLRTEKSMNKNFVSVYGFYSHQKEAVCLDAPDFSMAGYSHGSAGVS